MASYKFWATQPVARFGMEFITLVRTHSFVSNICLFQMSPKTHPSPMALSKQKTQ